MVMLVREEQLRNAEPPIEVTEDGMLVPAHPKISLFFAFSMIALQFSLES